jgi:hypothetical protein
MSMTWNRPHALASHTPTDRFMGRAAAHHRAHRCTYATYAPQTVPNSTHNAHTVPQTIAHGRPPPGAISVPCSMLLSSRRARGDLRHIQRLLAAAVEVEDGVVLGGHAPFGTCGGRGGTPRPAPTPLTRGRQRGSREEHIARRTASTTSAADRRSLPHTIVHILMERVCSGVQSAAAAAAAAAPCELILRPQYLLPARERRQTVETAARTDQHSYTTHCGLKEPPRRRLVAREMMAACASAGIMLVFCRRRRRTSRG